MQTTTGPLTEPETAEEAVMLAMLSVGKRMRQRQPGEELELSGLAVLKTLLHQGPMRLSVLAAQLELDASTVSRHARHLEDRGLLERAGDPDDGRASRVALTASGRECLEKGAARRRAMIGRVLDGWSAEDREQLRVLLSRLYLDLSTPQHPQENA
ncbi:MAG TPA: MarR family transcriptional regulator [Nocardioidaceae bacterium]|nr:MarR family transcriptional regulator [Nocardioidaceae bacterium]